MNLAYEAGSMLLENGAEIARVEETMSRIASHFEVEDNSFYVLSNGIHASAKGYARSHFIPIKGTNLEMVVDINQLSREIADGRCDADELESRLKAIRSARPKPALEQVLASALGAGAFGIIFGGSMTDCLAAFIAGLVLWAFMLFVCFPHVSRIVGNILGGMLASGLCLAMYKHGIGNHLSNIIIGAVIPLVPGVPFTNGIRDLANEDYLAGVTRLLDAMLSFLCIAMGMAMAFMIDATISGEMCALGTLTADTFTAQPWVQLTSAFLGTSAFAVLFGVPRRYYADCGLCGMVGWALYLLLFRNTTLSAAEVTFCATSLVTFTAMIQAIMRKCPITVFLICGIFPLVPGAGIFWTSYYIVSNQLNAAIETGFLALKITVAIAMGILLINELNGKGRITKLLRRL